MNRDLSLSAAHVTGEAGKLQTGELLRYAQSIINSWSPLGRMNLTERERHHLKRFIKELNLHRGRHTEFVSVYVPQVYDFFFQAEDGIRDWSVTGVQTCALPI